VAFRSEKIVLREAARGLLPEDILARRKQGQANPFRLWQAAGLLDHAATLLAEPALRARGLFEPRRVHRLLSRLSRGRGLPFDHNRLHLLVLIEIWHRVFLDPERLAPPAAGLDGMTAPAPAAGAAAAVVAAAGAAEGATAEGAAAAATPPPADAGTGGAPW